MLHGLQDRPRTTVLQLKGAQAVTAHGIGQEKSWRFGASPIAGWSSWKNPAKLDELFGGYTPILGNLQMGSTKSTICLVIEPTPTPLKKYESHLG